MLIIMNLVCTIVCGISCYIIGIDRGRKDERNRVERHIHSALRRRHSPSLCWVLNAVSERRIELMPEEQYFGDKQ